MKTSFPKIYGFNECSEMGRDVFAPSIFLAGCNLRCPYCMNAKLISNPPDEEINVVPLQKIKQYIEEDKSEWIMISGGEPTCTDVKLLQNLIEEIKSWNCKVGLSTNGSNYDIFKVVLPYLDYVALDIKSFCLDNFECDPEMEHNKNILHTKSSLVLKKMEHPEFDYELRTTLFPLFITKEVIKQIGGIIRQDENWVLQQFRVIPNMPASYSNNVDPYTEEQLQEILRIAMCYTHKAKIRYV